MPVDFVEIEKSVGLLLEVGEHRCQRFPANVLVGAEGGELGEGLQKVGVRVGGIRTGEDLPELLV